MVGFNEAAAIHRGNRPIVHSRSRRNNRFNEAAAIHRGNLRLAYQVAKRASCFNEAAAIHRGNLFYEPRKRPFEPASMRPRLFTAEIILRIIIRGGTNRASMRPRLFTAEIFQKDSLCALA